MNKPRFCFLVLLAVLLTGCSHATRRQATLVPPPEPPFPAGKQAASIDPNEAVWIHPSMWLNQTEAVCRVHNVARIEEYVPVKYGMIEVDPRSALFRARTFPHTWRFVAGGCVMEDNAPDRELVRYCPECRRAEEAWLWEQETTDKALAALEERIRSLNKAKDYRSAIPIARWELTIVEKNRGPDDPETAECQHVLGTLHQRNGDSAEAERLLTRSMLTMEKVLGPDDPRFAWRQTGLAGFHLGIGKYTEAAWLYARSLPVLERDGGPEDSKVIDTVMGLAHAHLGQGEYADAEALYSRDLAVLEKKSGPNDRQVAECLAFMVQLYEKTGRSEKAERLKKRIAAITARS